MAAGDTIWNVSVGSADHRTPAAVLEDHLLTGARDGTIYKLDKEDGSVVNSQDLGYEVREGMAITEDERYAYVVTSNGSDTDYVKWDIVNWTEVWRDTFSGLSDSVPAVDPDTNGTYLIVNDGTLRAYREDGSLRWTNTFPGSTSWGSKPAIDSQGRLFLGAGDTIASIKRDGGDAWSYDTNSIVEAGPIIDEETGYIFVGAADNQFYKVDRNGVVLESTGVGADIRSTAALSTDNERVVCGSDNNEVNIFDKDDLSLIHQSDPMGGNGHRGHYMADIDGRFLFFGSNGVGVINDDDGSVVWTKDVGFGTGENGLTMEPGRIYVAGSNGGVACLEHDSAPKISRQRAFELPYYHPAHHSYNPAAANRVLMVAEEIALRPGSSASGTDAVLYSEELARGEESLTTGDEVVMVTERVGQGQTDGN